MKRKNVTIISMLNVLCIFLLKPASLLSQQKLDNEFGISLSGFIKTDIMYNSRQTGLRNTQTSRYILYGVTFQ
jgi:hypothetical protein